MQKVYSGTLETVANQLIYLNIDHLAEGIYTLKITHNNKVITEVNFKK